MFWSPFSMQHMMITVQRRIRTMAMVVVWNVNGILRAGRPVVICALEGLTVTTGPGTMTGRHGNTHTYARP